MLLLLLLASPSNVVIVVNSNTLRHMVDLVHAHQSSCQLKHVVAQRDDDELRVLSPLLDVICYDRDLFGLSELVSKVFTSPSYVCR